jgi:hypothetical protein
LDAQEFEETPKGMVRRNNSSAQDPLQVAGKLFGSEGATTPADGVMGLETDPGGGSKSTFLAKRVLVFGVAHTGSSALAVPSMQRCLNDAL